MRVVIADDAVLLRQGVVRLLVEGGVDVVGEASNAGELLRLVDEHRPDVAIVDIRMPPSHTDEGLIAAQVIRRRRPETGVLVLSQYVDAAYALRLVDGDQSRCGYLLKDRVLDAEELVSAVHRVHGGDVVIDPGLVEELLTRRRDESALDELTEREREVLGLMAEGLTDEGSPSAYGSRREPWRPTSGTSSRSSASRPTRRSTVASTPCSSTCVPEHRAGATRHAGSSRSRSA